MFSICIQLHGCQCGIGTELDFSRVNVLLSAYCFLAPNSPALLPCDIGMFFLGQMIRCYASSLEGTRGQRRAFPGSSVFFLPHNDWQYTVPLYPNVPQKLNCQCILPVDTSVTSMLSESRLCPPALSNNISTSALLVGVLPHSCHPWVVYSLCMTFLYS